MFVTPKPTPAPTIKRVSVKNYLKGVVSANDDGRIPVDGLKGSTNTILTQDGTIRARPGTLPYGPPLLGTVLGEIFPFRKVTGATSTNWLICIQNVSGTANVYIAKGEDTTWTLCTGKNYDTTAKAHFIQVNNKVLVMNGVDYHSYLDIPTSTVIPTTALTTPTAPVVANNGSASLVTGTTNLKVYYSITWNSSVGETDGSAITTTSINKDRDLWDPTTNSMLVTRGTIPAGAASWNVYAGVGTSSGGTPQLYAIATGLDIAVTTFTDDGSRPLQLTLLLPTFNSTAGMKVTRGEVINGRPWLLGDTDNPYYVWRGGDPGFELDFSPSNGGGFSLVGGGTENVPVKVAQFRDGKGTAGVTVFSQGLSGHGKRFILSPQSITYGNSTFIVYQVTEDNGVDGTDSPDGVVIVNDSAWYPSRGGFKTTGTKPQLQNLLSTSRVDQTIMTDIKNLNSLAMSGCVGMAFEGRIYWAVPVASNTNNQIWVLDLDRQGAWMKPWTIAADWMLLYTDNTGLTHHLILSNNQIFEFSYTAMTVDNGVAFPTDGTSGQIKFSEDGMMWGKVVMVIFTVLREQGDMVFTVSGNTKQFDEVQVGTNTLSQPSVTSRVGWGEPGLSWNSPRGWSEIVGVPTTSNPAAQYVKVKVNKDLRWFNYSWSTTTAGTDYSIADVVAIYAEAGIKDLS